MLHFLFVICCFVTFFYFFSSLSILSSSLSAEKNRLQPFVNRLVQAKGKKESFGLQTSNHDQNKTPFQYYEKHQARVKKLLDDMQGIIDNPEKEKNAQ